MNIVDVGPQVQCDDFTDLYFVAIGSIFCNRALIFFFIVNAIVVMCANIATLIRLILI